MKPPIYQIELILNPRAARSTDRLAAMLHVAQSTTFSLSFLHGLQQTKSAIVYTKS